MTIWTFHQMITRRLLSWAGASMATGFSLLWRGDPFQQGVGVQFAGWGFINMLIALFGERGSRQRSALPEANAAATVARETGNLRRILLLNTGLDVLYMLGGWRLARTKGHDDERWRGQGWGIVVQGAFLFFFDLIHVLLLPKNVKRET